MDLSARIFRLLFPSAVFESAHGHVYLTFDDGPHPVATPAVLEVLRQSGIRATFFLTGARVLELPEIARRIVRENHRVGNHGFQHRAMVFRRSEEIRKDIAKCNQAITETVGQAPTLFRPPFGYYDHRVLRIAQSLDMKLVHWSHDLKDFSGNARPESMRRRAERVDNGSIVLLHDNDATASAIGTYLPPLVESLKGRGFTFNVLD